MIEFEKRAMIETEDKEDNGLIIQLNLRPV